MVYLQILQRQLRYFDARWSGGLKFNLERELRLFGYSLGFLLVCHLANIILNLVRDVETNELIKLRLNIVISVMTLVTDIVNKISSNAIVYVQWQWTKPLIPDKSRLMKRIEGLERSFSVEK